MARRGFLGLVTCGAYVLVFSAVALARQPARGTASQSVGGEDTSRAVGLYHEARYEEALEILEGLNGGTSRPSPQARQAIAEYQALCLLALDRPEDAEAVIADLVTDQPGYRPRSSDFPPRFVTLAGTVRNRLLPRLVQAEYRAARESFDRKDHVNAASRFRNVLEMVDQQGLDAETGRSLAEMKELASGFLVIVEDAAARAALPPASPVASLPPPPPEPPKSFYTGDDPGVTPPVAVSQQIPEWRASFGTLPPGTRRGYLELTIDSTGRVEGARLIAPIHPIYDAHLLATARQWRYSPATKDGKPVRFVKAIQITLVEGLRR